MEENLENKNTKVDLSTIGFFLFGVLLIIAGVALMVSKFIGFPFLFEGIIMMAMGFGFMFLLKILTTFFSIIEIVTDVINGQNLTNEQNRIIEDTISEIQDLYDLTQANVELPVQEIVSISLKNGFGVFLDKIELEEVINLSKTKAPVNMIYDILMNIREYKELSPEEQKQKTEEIDKIIIDHTTLLNDVINNVTNKSNVKPAQKEFSLMSKEELQFSLTLALTQENFEQAAVIRDILATKN